ncbi:mechanosensitive ion channel family protein [Candidatus Poribacteria bacterium]|nr:mechanosensitive ion channel family protein [Candidatus Poribacteria bacterium]
MVISTTINKLIQIYADNNAPALPVSLSKNFATVVIFLIGGLFIMNSIGISIAPILTALGVGGLAVALALQDTLSNFFAGLYVTISRQIRLGDYIKLESGEEGYITDITWRSTKIRSLANNIIIIPNTKLSQTIVTNYFLPEKKMGISISIGVSYNADIDYVEKVLMEEAAIAQKEVAGMSKDKLPIVRLIPGFGDFSINFTLLCQIDEFENQFSVQHELRKRILKRFNKEKIEIPYPVRTIINKS